MSAPATAAGLILAAGESRRMGSPKALLPFQESTFLDTLIALLAPFCRPVVVVLGAHAERVRAAAMQPAHFVTNPDYLSGQTGSMQCGLRAVPADAEGVLFTLVDHPAVSAATIEALLASPRPLVRVPRHGGERGHPIWFRRELVAEFLALPPGEPANRVVRAHRGETEFLDVDDAGVLADIDDPASFERLTAATRQRA